MSGKRSGDGLTPRQRQQRDQGRDSRRAIRRAARDAPVPRTGLPHLLPKRQQGGSK